ncbi:hypothetical protein [Consotaella aegiceratis]|uniref:hypothetical protein n=1 Tax=Consotaella aegiceratis TaxID=3097961 RepID=UPI002F40F189
MTIEIPSFPDMAIEARFYSIEEGGPKNKFALGYVPLMAKMESEFREFRFYFDKNVPIEAGMIIKGFLLFLDKESVAVFRGRKSFLIGVPRIIGEARVISLLD